MSSPVAAREICVQDIESAKSVGKSREEQLTTLDVFRRILPAAAGSFVEWYDFGIYSYIGTYVTANFFEPMGGSVATWAGFGVTFLFRPLGGFVVGHLADTFGRKRAMQITIAMMLVTSVLQGILPSFVWPGEGWGWVGAVLLLLIRALQGFSAGGELATAAVYISEVSPKATLGFNLSWLSVFGAFGSWVVASLIVFALECIFTPEEMKQYGWRIPYFLALIPGAIIIYFRQYLEETSGFEELQEAKESVANSEHAAVIQKGPIQELLANHKLAMLIATMGSACAGAFWFVPTFYGPELIKESNPGVLAKDVTLSEMLVYGIPALFAPLVGMLVDRVGVGKVYTLTVLLCGVLLPLPLWYYWGHLSSSQATEGMYIGEVIVGFLGALTTCIYVWMVELFPVQVRATGVAVAYNIGVGICGGFGPLLCALLKETLPPQSVVSAPAAVCLTLGVIAMVGVVLAPLLARKGKLQLTHIRESPY